jgi:hypothetical protein
LTGENSAVSAAVHLQQPRAGAFKVFIGAYIRCHLRRSRSHCGTPFSAILADVDQLRFRIDLSFEFKPGRCTAAMVSTAFDFVYFDIDAHASFFRLPGIMRAFDATIVCTHTDMSDTFIGARGRA